MESTTVRLTKILKSGNDIHDILHENETAAPTLHTHLENLLITRDLKRQDVITRAGLDGNYANQFFNGTKTKPSRNHVLSLAFGFSLNNDETDRLLKIAGVGALYPKNKRDAVLIHAIENKKPVIETNEILFSLGLETLAGRA